MTLPSFHDIRAAADRLHDRIVRTPLTRSAWLSDLTGADVWLKLENRQIEGSFKIRGAFNALLRSPVAGAVTASAGNHGRALACAAKELNMPVTVFVPRTAPRAKLDPIRAHGATLVLCETYDEAESDAIAHARDRDVPYISPYNNPEVIAGAGTVGLEIFEDLPDVDLLVVPVGGGGLVSGIALAAAGHGNTEAIGVEAAASPVFTTALAHGHLVTVKVGPTLADGLAGNAEPGSITFDLVRDLGVPIAAVGEDQIERAMRALAANEGETAEGAGAVGVAFVADRGGLQGKRVTIIVSGGNVDPDRLR
ncbi:MAG: threonine/serine dehydratase [Vicinamibacterales bacterium]